METCDWKYWEVAEVIKALKKHKTPGPDGCTTELFKFMDTDVLMLLTKSINNFRQHENLPETLTAAIIASIFLSGHMWPIKLQTHFIFERHV